MCDGGMCWPDMCDASLFVNPPWSECLSEPETRNRNKRDITKVSFRRRKLTTVCNFDIVERPPIYRIIKQGPFYKLPPILEESYMKRLPKRLPETTNAYYGLMALCPLDPGGALVSRPSVFSYKVR